jgi:hypothetical protein
MYGRSTAAPQLPRSSDLVSLSFFFASSSAVCESRKEAARICAVDLDAPASSNPILPVATETTHKPRKHSRAKQTSKKQWSPYQYGGREVIARREV